MRKVYFKIIICIFGLSILFAEADTNNKVQKINEVIKAQGLNWRAEENWVTRLSEEERKKLVGPKIDYDRMAKITKNKMLTLAHLSTPPSQLDWRDSNVVTPVRNQLSCGSCWAFSAVGQIESWWLEENNRQDTVNAFDLSEQFLLSEKTAGSCQGGNVEMGLRVAKNTGIPPEWCLEYQASDDVPLDSACSNWEDHVYKIPGWGYITRAEASVNNIKNALQYHPVSASYEVYESFYSYGGGVYEPLNTENDTVTGNHAILIVGYNDADSSWICKNSWGKYWPEDSVDLDNDGILDSGYFKIKWGTCNIGNYMPFVWDNLAPPNSISLGQSTLAVTLKQGESIQRTLNIQNSSQDTVHFAATDYAVPIYFHPDTFNAYKGQSWWCGDPDIQGYSNHVLQYLEIGEFSLENIGTPYLDFKSLWSIENPEGASAPWDGWDGWNVRISTDGGDSIEVLEPITPDYDSESLWSFGHDLQGWNQGINIPGWTGKSDGWQDVQFDLSEYKSKNVLIRFAFASDMGWCTIDDPELDGLFIDNIAIYDLENKEDTIYSNKGEYDEEINLIGYGEETAEWISVTNSPGTINPGESYSLKVDFDTKNLRPGEYNGKISLESNDEEHSSRSISVSLTVEEEEQDIADSDKRPGSFRLMGNYPNPFNASTRIEYYLPVSGKVELTVFNLHGQKIYQAARTYASGGYKYLSWDGVSSSGVAQSSGVYIYKIRFREKYIARSGKMLMVK